MGWRLPARMRGVIVCGDHAFRWLSHLPNIEEDRDMSIIGWLVLGLVAGFIASKIVNRSGDGFVLDIILGIVGALAGGAIFSSFDAVGVTGLNLHSMIVSVIGAVVVLVVYHAVVGRRAI
jgi:uncharacterized membrane protein YeaQ/YmgE (transglycosylase-associated protein family)